MKTFIALLFCCLPTVVFAQTDKGLFSRLRGLYHENTEYLNVDGMEITSQKIDGEFSKKNILKHFKRYDIKESELNNTDSLLGFEHFYVRKSKQTSPGLTKNTSWYFLKNKDQKLTGVSIAAINKTDTVLERELIELIYKNAIPNDVFSPMSTDTVNFAGRKIHLGGSCQWRGVNNVQCPYNGQMNWSVHKTREDAANNNTEQFAMIKEKGGFKVLTDTTVNVIFEGTEVPARKIIVDIKGLNSLLVGMSGGKTLTVYFVVCPVRGNFVSCVMSFWNNDDIGKGGLPLLLEEVMTLKDKG